MRTPTTKKPKFKAGSPISPLLFGALKHQFYAELELAQTRNARHVQNHVFSLSGIAAFQLAVTVWEAILNEQFLSDLVREMYRENPLFEFVDEIERWSVLEKTKRLPRLLFGESIDTSTQVFSDLHDLVQIRNSVTHFKNSLFEGPDSAIRSLNAKKVTYPKPPNSETPWHNELMSTECIRFSVNTVSNLVHELSRLETEEYRQRCSPVFALSFMPISDSESIEQLKKHGFDPEKSTDVGY